MPTPQPPSAFWRGVMDAPVEQDASYLLDRDDRKYVDDQIRALQNRALAVAASTSTGGDWRVALDLDLTIVAPQQLGVDRSYLIGSNTWIKSGSSSETFGTGTSSQIVGGSGLLLQPSGFNATYRNGSPYQFGPMLRLALADVIPNWDPMMPIRAWCTTTAENEQADNDYGVHVGFDNGGTNQNTTSQFILINAIHRGFSGGVWIIYTTSSWANIGYGSGNAHFPNIAGVRTYPTMMAYCPDGVCGAKVVGYISTSTAVGGFPAAGTMLPIAGSAQGAVTTFPNDPTSPTALGPWYLAIGAQTGNSGSQYTISRIRLDYKV